VLPRVDDWVHFGLGQTSGSGGSGGGGGGDFFSPRPTDIMIKGMRCLRSTVLIDVDDESQGCTCEGPAARARVRGNIGKRRRHRTKKPL
jgi:hypothetical protein